MPNTTPPKDPVQQVLQDALLQTPAFLAHLIGVKEQLSTLMTAMTAYYQAQTALAQAELATILGRQPPTPGVDVRPSATLLTARVVAWYRCDRCRVEWWVEQDAPPGERMACNRCQGEGSRFQTDQWPGPALSESRPAAALNRP